MTEPIQTIKVFVNHENCLNFKCPACQEPKIIKVDSLRTMISPLKVRCSCKTIFSLDIDYRRFYRKQTKLPGTYRSIQPHSTKELEILIIDISKEGIRFRSFTGHKIRKGDTLLVTCELDDYKKTSLQKNVIVKSLNRDDIGCCFSGQDLFEKELGFYLQL